MSITKNFREPARQFCREKDFPNVDLIEAAMERAAALVVADVTQVVGNVTDEMVTRRERANAPQ